MNPLKVSLLGMVATLSLHVSASDLPPEVLAKFLKIIASGAGGKVACQDPVIKSSLEAAGVTIDASSGVMWITTPFEAKMNKSLGKLLIGGKHELLGACAIVIEEDSGHPKILINPVNLKGSRVQVGDAILKLGQRAE